MRRHLLITATVLIGIAGARLVTAGEVPRARESITLQADGEHCVVRNVRLRCTELVPHLRDTLKLPQETILLLRAGRGAPHEAIRNVLEIIDKSGFSHLVPMPTAPPTLKEK